MDVCIISNMDDDQAIMVERALLAKGCRVNSWYWPDFPSVTQLSVEFDEDGHQQLPLRDALTDGCAIWAHRGMYPVAPDWLHVADRPFARNECQEFLSGLFDRLAIDAFCVNPIAAARRYRYKINQLDLAAQCGLPIPPTLISNDPQRVRAFYHQYPGHVIVKHATQMAWETSTQQVYVPYTSRITRPQLGNDLQLQACPSIYQAEIAKCYEMRIVFIGENLFPVKIDSQARHNLVDWRNNDGALPPCCAWHLAEAERKKILQMIRISGLLQGSIDAIVNHEEQLVFIELNESGRFLWIEHLVPSFHLLDCFCEFLMRKDPKMVYTRQNSIVTVGEYCRYTHQSIIEERCRGHVPGVDASRLYE